MWGERILPIKTHQVKTLVPGIFSLFLKPGNQSDFLEEWGSCRVLALAWELWLEEGPTHKMPQGFLAQETPCGKGAWVTFIQFLSYSLDPPNWKKRECPQRESPLCSGPTTSTRIRDCERKPNESNGRGSQTQARASSWLLTKLPTGIRCPSEIISWYQGPWLCNCDGQQGVGWQPSYYSHTRTTTTKLLASFPERLAQNIPKSRTDIKSTTSVYANPPTWSRHFTMTFFRWQNKWTTWVLHFTLQIWSNVSNMSQENK